MSATFATPSSEHVTSVLGITPCIAGLISSGSNSHDSTDKAFLRFRRQVQLPAGAGARGLHEHLLHPESESRARMSDEPPEQVSWEGELADKLADQNVLHRLLLFRGRAQRHEL